MTYKMKVYRVTRRRSGNEHDGYSYFSNKAKAEIEQKKENKILYIDELEAEQEFEQPQPNNDSVEEIDFDLSKKGILELLNIHCSYPDNG